MPKRTSSYHSWLVEKLKVPQVAESYLRTALDDSQEAFLTALRNVAEARGMAKVAEETGLNRESLYRTLSNEGNPTLNTLRVVLDALGLRIDVAEKHSATIAPATPVPAQAETNASIRIVAGTSHDLDLASASFVTVSFANSATSTNVTFGGYEQQILDIQSIPFYMLGAQVSQRQEANQG
jgi:probable addiction module antidote protein